MDAMALLKLILSLLAGDRSGAMGLQVQPLQVKQAFKNNAPRTGVDIASTR